MVSFLNHIVFWGRFRPKQMFFDQMKDNVSWPPCSNDRFDISKHLLNHVWVTEAVSWPQKRPNSQYPVWARASGEAIYPLFKFLNGKFTKAIKTL